jgi:hypothetical protein
MICERRNTVIARPPAVEKIMSYSNLNDGWDCGMGNAQSIIIIERAIDLYNQFYKFGFGIDSAPMRNGGITLIFYKGPYFVDVSINPTNTYNIREEVGVGANYEITNQEYNVSLQRIEQVLNATIKKCFSSEPLIAENTSPANEDFYQSASVIWETASLSSKQTAQSRVQALSVSIS